MWQKGDKVYDGKGIVVGDHWHSNPTSEMFRADGWEWVEPPKRYSKLKVIRALGERWPAKKLQLEQAGLWDQFVAAAWLDESDPAFAAVLATLTDAEKEMLKECLYDE